MSVTVHTKRPLVYICHLLLGKQCLVSNLDLDNEPSEPSKVKVIVLWPSLTLVEGATAHSIAKVKAIPNNNHTPSKSEIKSVSNNRYCSSTSRTSTPSQSPYYQPQEDQETYYINSEGHLQCHQDSQNIIKAPTPQELPRSKEHPIFHKPGSMRISGVEDLLKLYPNSFD